MTTKRLRYDLTAADTKIIGTDYQFFYFINELLKLKKGQSLGYEVKDDVHIDLPCGRTVLIQLKHTTQKQANNQPINLTKLDKDLLHTLNNWISVVRDEQDDRGTKSKQKEFINKTSFILATNKMIDNNVFINKMVKATDSKKKLDDFITYLHDLLKECEGVKTIEYLNNMLKMDKGLFRLFISNISIQVQADAIIEDIKQSIVDKYIRYEKTNDVFSDIFYELKVYFFDKVNQGEKCIITYDEWLPKGIAIFEKYQTTNLPIRTFNKALPKNLSDQPFIKELISIGDISENEIEQMAEYTEFLLRVDMNLKEWYDNGEITLSQKELFHEQAITYWKNIHRKCHRRTNFNNDFDHALDCLDEVRSKEVNFEKTKLDIQLSNGEFYYLSNNHRVGWVKNWEGQYKK